MAEHKDWVKTDYAVDKCKRCTNYADEPEHWRQARFVALYRVGNLIGIAREENKLGTCAINHQPQRYVGVMDESVYKVWSIHGGGYECYHRHAVEHNSYG